MVVLDASAILALWLQEPGWTRVAQIAARSSISVVNLAESIGRMARKGMPSDRAVARLDALGAVFVPLTRDVAVHAGLLAASTRPLGLSLGDRVCIAQAVALGLPVMTVDRRLAAFG